MKNISLLTVLLLFATSSISQEITRGPEIGEIYFMGPTATVLYDAIYRSTDFGETAVCVDSISSLTNNIGSIAADKTPGGLYFVTMLEQLYYSGNYGQFSSWELRQGGIFNELNSGIQEGYIFEGGASHSEDFGYNFIPHDGNGAFGNYRESEIGYNNKGYLMTYENDGTDTLYFFISNDNFNNLNLAYKFNISGYGFYLLSYGFENGSLFFYNTITKELYISNDDGFNWTKKNSFTCPNLPIEGITGGRQDGELYMLVVYRQAMGYIRHVYIYHSLDYGETFTIHHPVSFGTDPVYADFEVNDTLGKPPFEVQFTDLSNSPMSWEWDFNNDDIVDSYEQNPTYIYEDTGYFTVSLKIQYNSIEDIATRYDYIHVTDITNVAEKTLSLNPGLSCYPNPFSEKVKISFSPPENIVEGNILIYSTSGKLINELKIDKNLLNNEYIAIWYGRNIDGKKVKPGIYYCVLNSNRATTKKIILTY